MCRHASWTCTIQDRAVATVASVCHHVAQGSLLAGNTLWHQVKCTDHSSTRWQSSSDEDHCLFIAFIFQVLGRFAHALILQTLSESWDRPKSRDVTLRKLPMRLKFTPLELMSSLYSLCRFVPIGLCWLYGRSEIPPPPPPLCLQHKQKFEQFNFKDSSSPANPLSNSRAVDACSARANRSSLVLDSITGTANKFCSRQNYNACMLQN